MTEIKEKEIIRAKFKTPLYLLIPTIISLLFPTLPFLFFGLYGIMEKNDSIYNFLFTIVNL